MNKELLSTIWGLLLLAAAVLPSFVQFKKKRDLARREAAGKLQPEFDGAAGDRSTVSPGRGIDGQFSANRPYGNEGTERYGGQDYAPLTSPMKYDHPDSTGQFGSIDFSGIDNRLESTPEGESHHTAKRYRSTVAGAETNEKPRRAEQSQEICTDREDDPTADFNLRQAVIYAEILNPKFGPQAED